MVFLDRAPRALHQQNAGTQARSLCELFLSPPVPFGRDRAFWRKRRSAGAENRGLRKQEAASNEEMNIGAYIELLRTDIRDYKTQIVADVMALDAKQTVKFWPVYKEFEAEFSAVGD